MLLRNTYQDLHITIDKQLADDECVVTCMTVKGIHKGYWMGIKPTEKLISITSVNIDKVRNGKIIEHGGATNLFFPMLEVGAIRLVRDEERI